MNYNHLLILSFYNSKENRVRQMPCASISAPVILPRKVREDIVDAITSAPSCGELLNFYKSEKFDLRCYDWIIEPETKDDNEKKSPKE